jgi:hypothetical protein
MEQINWNNYIVKIEHILQNKLEMLYTDFLGAENQTWLQIHV